MARKHAPLKGSRAYSPRKRAKRMYPRVSSWPTEEKETKLLGFAGYKAGMTHMFIKDNLGDTSTTGKEVFTPVTVLECPPIVPFALRVYKINEYGRKAVGHIWADNLLDKNSPSFKILSKKITIPAFPSAEYIFVFIIYPALKLNLCKVFLLRDLLGAFSLPVLV